MDSLPDIGDLVTTSSAAHGLATGIGNDDRQVIQHGIGPANVHVLVRRAASSLIVASWSCRQALPVGGGLGDSDLVGRPSLVTRLPVPETFQFQG